MPEHEAIIDGLLDEKNMLIEALRVLLDQVDYTSGACALNEPVGGVLPTEIIRKAKDALAKVDKDD